MAKKRELRRRVLETRSALSCLCEWRHAHRKRNRPPALEDLPDNASLEDIQYHIYVREKIERGLRDVEAGRVVDQDEAKRRMAKWLGE